MVDCISIGELLLESTTVRVEGSHKIFADESKSLTSKYDENWVLVEENKLRKMAYANTPIKKEPSFFKNGDMSKTYYILLVYEKKSGTPLLSARYYFDTEMILKYISGKEASATEGILNIIQDIKQNKIDSSSLFLIDRMSVNIANQVYRNYRWQIISMFQMELLKHTRNCPFFAMAREDKQQKLAKKYETYGLEIIGSCNHQGKSHYVMYSNMEHCYKVLKESISKRLGIKITELPV